MDHVFSILEVKKGYNDVYFLMQTIHNPYKPLYEPSFLRLFHLIFHCWGNAPEELEIAGAPLPGNNTRTKT